jgi:hypothetical protein
VLLHELPVADDRGASVVAGLLLGAVGNLLAVVVLAPALVGLLRRRRPDLPKVVARNYAGVGLVVAVSAAILAGGLLHRPALEAQHRAYRAQLVQVATYVHERAPDYRSRLGGADTIELGPGYYRTCVPGDATHHRLCLYVDTSERPPGITRDDHVESNAQIVRFED